MRSRAGLAEIAKLVTLTHAQVLWMMRYNLQLRATYQRVKPVVRRKERSYLWLSALQRLQLS